MTQLHVWAHALYLWLHAINPMLPWVVLVMVPCWCVPWAFRRFFPHAWEALPGFVDRVALDLRLPVDFFGSKALAKIIQGLPSVLLGAVSMAIAMGGDPKAALQGALAGAFAPLWHELLKALPFVPYVGGVWPAATKSAETPPPVPPAAGGAVVLVLVALALGNSSCSVFQGAKPYIRTANDAARAVCASYESAKTGEPVDKAFDGFCALEENWGPFLSTILAKQAQACSGMPLTTAALPEHCVVGAAGSDISGEAPPKMPVGRPAADGGAP